MILQKAVEISIFKLNNAIWLSFIYNFKICHFSRFLDVLMLNINPKASYHIIYIFILGSNFQFLGNRFSGLTTRNVNFSEHSAIK